ncbi:MAG: hypothetical protein JXA66_02980, partial [Oligoflexia bacterium]|nr:hypothetical protein [Oligoflexia bacterium]
MLCRIKYFVIGIILVLAACASETEVAMKSLKGTIEKYKTMKKELDMFYIERNNSRKLTDDISVVSDYYSKMLLLNDFTWEYSGKIREWKKILYKSDLLKHYKIPKVFMRRDEDYNKIKVELNLKLSIIVPRMRKTAHAPGEARANLTGVASENDESDSSTDYYNKGAENIRKGDKNVVSSDARRGPRENSSVYDV